MATPLSLTQRRGSSALVDRGFRMLALVAGAAVLAILALIAASTTRDAWPVFAQEGLGFVTSAEWNPAEGRYGALAFIYGTMLISMIALVIAVPVSVGIALFITEIAPPRLRNPVTYLVDLLAAIPSVVYGLWGVLVFGPFIIDVYDKVSRSLGGVPVVGLLFRGPVNQKSFMTAGIILAMMIIPIITAITREVFATVPPDDKAGALALGATRWEMIRGAVFPYARSGLVGAVMLGLGRAMGETIAAALVIGSAPSVTVRLFSSGDAMAAVIANQFGEASGVHRAALIGLGVVLFAMTILVNVSARVIVSRAERRMGAPS